MMVGSYGGSYGGMYQVLLYAVDPKHRLRVLAPDITPHDLTYSLDPNGVVKSGWGLALVVGGETSITQIIKPTDTVGPVTSLRPEEHTTELKSLMRNTYAVFRLTKQKQQHKKQTC